MYISAISKSFRGTGQQFIAVGRSISSFYPAYSNGHFFKQWVINEDYNIPSNKWSA